MRILIASLAVLFFVGCNKGNEDYSIMGPEILKEWRIILQASEVTPSPQGRNDNGTLTLQVRENRSIVYQYNITTLAQGDMITGGAIYAGPRGSNGMLMFDLEPRPSPAYATGVRSNLRQSLIDSLLNSNISKYVQLSSTALPAGVVRGQLE